MPAPSVAAETPLLVGRVIEHIPRSADELDAMHAESRFPCVELPAGDPLDDRGFGQRIWYDVRPPAGGARRSLLYDWGRWPVLTFGTRMNARDQADLPFFTSGAILERIDNSYVSIQVRVHRAAPDGVPYLYYVPIAGVGGYGNAKRTEEFTDLQRIAVNGFRGLGLFVKPGEARRPETLRTLVAAIKGSRVVSAEDETEVVLDRSLELMFVRMRVAEPGNAPVDAADKRIELHAFGTTGDLAELVYFQPYVAPKTPDDCGVCSTIRITEYNFAGQNPAARAARHLQFRALRQYPLRELDEFAERSGMSGDALDNLTEVLDAVIDDRIAVP